MHKRTSNGCSQTVFTALQNGSIKTFGLNCSPFEGFQPTQDNLFTAQALFNVGKIHKIGLFNPQNIQKSA